MPLEFWLVMPLVPVFLGLGIWRWIIVNQPALTERECLELSESVVQDLFESAPDSNVLVRVPFNYWQRYDLTGSQWIYLCRWMRDRGIVLTPDGWDWIQVLVGEPPKALALTPKIMEMKISSFYQSNIHIGDGNGPINIGGRQAVISGQGLSGDDLRALVHALRNDARTLPELEASNVRAAADSLQSVADGRLSETSPEAVGALKWVRSRVSDAIGGAGGAALWAGTVAVAKSLGWFS